jgi:membrane protein
MVGLAANVVLLMAMFRLLARPPTPARSLWQGAMVGAVAFEILKQASSYLLASTRQQPAFQAFGIALILLVWINYFSRVVMYAASWAHTSPAARADRDSEHRPVSPRTMALPQRHGGDRRLRAGVGAARSGGPAIAADEGPRATGRRGPRRPDPRLAFGAGAAVALGLVAALRRRRG